MIGRSGPARQAPKEGGHGRRRLARLVLALAGLLALTACQTIGIGHESRSALEAAYLRSPQDRVSVLGMRLHVRDDGPRHAPALLFIHGFASSLQTFEPWAKMLEDRYRVIRFDLPGYGLSDMDPTGDYSDARTLAVIAALMDRLSIGKATLVGNSMGGRYAWEFAATHRRRVARLVLVSPDGFRTDPSQYGRRADIPFVADIFTKILPKALVRSGLESAYGDPSQLKDAAVDRTYDLLTAPGVREAALARFAQAAPPDPRKLLPRVEAPTLILWGARDHLIPVPNAFRFAALIPDARIVVLPDLGHVPQEEAPAISIRPLRAFLAGHGLVPIGDERPIDPAQAGRAISPVR